MLGDQPVQLDMAAHSTIWALKAASMNPNQTWLNPPRNGVGTASRLTQATARYPAVADDTDWTAPAPQVSNYQARTFLVASPTMT